MCYKEMKAKQGKNKIPLILEVVGGKIIQYVILERDFQMFSLEF